MATEGTPRLAAFAPASSDAFKGQVIIDCTSVSRFGLRGTGAYEWLSSRGLPVPEVNRAVVDAAGMLMLRLGRNDIAISGNSEGAMSVAVTAQAWQNADGRKGYDGFRRDGWAHIVISGPMANELMAELTEVDLRDRSLPVNAVAQTRVMHLDTIIVRTDLAGVPGYELFFDIASRPYILEGLHHIAHGYRFSAVE
jgi:sarcosine oxidase subunit gamma